MNTKSDLVIAVVFSFIIGAAVVISGLVTFVTGDPYLLHPRHLEGASPSSLVDLARGCGSATMLAGAGIPLFILSLAGLGGLRNHGAIRAVVGSVGAGMLVAGTALALYAILSHGGTL